MRAIKLSKISRLMREIPGMLVVNPADDVSAKKLLNEVVDTDGPAYVRLGRSGVPVIYDESSDIKIGKAKCNSGRQ